MKTFVYEQRERALTLIEVLAIIAVLAFLFMMFLPATSTGGKARVAQLRCVTNLKQIGQAEFAWANNHGGKFSFQLTETNGGTMEYTTGANAWRHFQLLSNMLDTPKLLFCPGDPDRKRKASTNFTTLSNSNLSYFVGLDVSETNPNGILFGDRNITNGTPIKNGILELTTNQPAGWTGDMHKNIGNVVLSDGSVQQLSGSGLRATIGNTGVFTNRLQMPILNP
jgi:competence protein ComGC